jgi:hypothetical protein
MHEHDRNIPATFRVTLPGPFEYHDVVVDGRSVPLLRAHPKKSEDAIRLILDGRRSVELSIAEAERLIPFLADAIAMALGYGAHPRSPMERLPERTPHMTPRRAVEVLSEDAA